MVSVEDKNIPGAGYELKSAIWDAAKPIIEEWTGMEQQPSSMYGIRVYTEGAILSPHADRLPLVSSCIINVAQDVDEEWVLEVFDREGNSVNVTMAPGDMVLYESGSLIHGVSFRSCCREPNQPNLVARKLMNQFPFTASFRPQRKLLRKVSFSIRRWAPTQSCRAKTNESISFYSIFIHFQPTGKPLDFDNYDFVEEMDDFYPPYILKDSEQAAHWKQRNPTGWHQESPSGAHIDTLPAFEAAAVNDLEVLHRIASEDRRSLIAKDRNGWQPIHEAARGGHVDSIEFLLKNGADINARTHKGNGVSPLRIAREALGDNHAVVKFLKDLGAKEFGPEL